MPFLAYKIRNQIMGVYQFTSHVYANYCFGHDFAGVNLDSVLWRLCLWVPPAIVILLCVQQTLNFLQGVKEGASVPLPIPLRLYPTSGIVLEQFCQILEQSYLRGFVLQNTEGDRYAEAKNGGRHISGAMACLSAFGTQSGM